MNVITFDIGNSRIKADIWSDHNHISHYTLETIEEAISLVTQHLPDGVALCSVATDTTDIYSRLSATFNGFVKCFTSQSSLREDIEESYRGQLGADRLAAFLGAVSLFPDEALMIVDSGTALTIDVVDSNGIFRGGNISLGIGSRLKALHEFTARLPLVEVTGKVSEFGNSTDTAIRNGAILGATGEILYEFEKAKLSYGVKRIIFTGGDANIIIPFIAREGINVYHDPYLVGRGLNEGLLISRQATVSTN